MSCSNDAPHDGLLAERRQQLKVGFNAMWPAGNPFPPAMPWLAAVVNRGEAWGWVVSLARQDGNIRLDSPALALDFVGRAMTGDGVYRNERKKKKKKKTPAACPHVTTQWNQTCEIWQTVTVDCNGDVTIDPPCEGDVTGRIGSGRTEPSTGGGGGQL